MDKIIVTGFSGADNSSRLLTETVGSDYIKLIFPNDKEKAAEILRNKISEVNPACVVITGQKPLIKNKIAVEAFAKRNGHVLHTKMCCASSVRIIKEHGFNAYISEGCGSSYCNHIYYECLSLGVNCILLHIPSASGISDFTALENAFKGYINNISAIPSLL